MEGDAVGIEIPGGPDELCTVVYGDEYERLSARYEESGEIEEQDRERVFGTAARVLGQCPDPHGPPARRTGLALGKVQSGKTMSYITLSALAFDSGYRVVIVLAGRTKALAEQNKARFDRELIGVRSAPRIATFHNPDTHRETEIQAVLETDNLVLITLLKTQSRIGKIAEMFGSPELNRYPVLIIDDEGDQASHNTKKNKGEQSAVHAHILEMREALPHHAYVAYTATPQANLLIDTIDALSPEFCVLVEPGKGYTGGATFFGPDSPGRDRYVRIVPDEEAENDDPVGVPEHLELAVATFLVSGAMLHLRKQHAFHSMLIHNSNKKVDHERLHEAVEAMIFRWREALLLPDTDPGTQEVLGPARIAYEDLSGTAREVPPWEEVSAQLRHEVKGLMVWLVNSLKKGMNPSTTPFNLQNNIMIGGNMLDRGVTIPGLAVTYITRPVKSTQADTVEQRARWFGYKEAYLDLCRVFTSKKILQVYTELVSHEEAFWESLSRWQAQQGLTITKWPRLLRLGLGLRPTRISIARIKAFKGQGWIVQRRPPTDRQVASSNVRTARAFFDGRPDATLRSYGNLNHLVVPECSPEDVTALLAEMERTEDEDWDSSYVIEYLERLALGNRLSQMDVLLMVNGEPRQRTRTSPLGSINPMQGRTPGRAPSHPEFYPGDQNIHNERVQLQVHVLTVRDSKGQPWSKETLALALYVPPDARYDLGQLVVPSGA
jgi:hypothetical protein